MLNKTFKIFIPTLLLLIIPILALIELPQLEKIAVKITNSYPGYDLGGPYPQPNSQITSYLISKVGLKLGNEFNGRVATMLGRNFPHERYWGKYAMVHYLAQIKTGNLHDGPGLWQDNIPTLFQYNPLTSPAYFVFVRRFFTFDSDVTIRNLIGTRMINIPLLKLAGIRFILTDEIVVDSNLDLVISQKFVVTSDEKKLLGFSENELNNYNLFLYEIKDFNHGQYSPTLFKVIDNVSDTLDFIDKNANKLDEIAAIGIEIPYSLTKAHLSKFTIIKNGYHLEAKSPQWSILVLPAEFSNCLSIYLEGESVKPILLQVDSLFTGVLFKDSINANIIFKSGLFGAGFCRMQDWIQAKKNKMSEAFISAPKFGKIGWGTYWEKTSH